MNSEPRQVNKSYKTCSHRVCVWYLWMRSAEKVLYHCSDKSGGFIMNVVFMSMVFMMNPQSLHINCLELSMVL